ncbi:kinase-like protein [Leucogyrophana mollusca]|uniref:Kinase-like protein n=1 Tax=Leucogyrophana mollusca TaxID=85980 RepID=A0ACB8BM46_9AGAM|nr:kinase-like protein [Leucogyrophana mollusca]
MFEPSDLSDHILLQHAPAQSPPVRPAIQSFQLTAVDSAYLGPRPDSFIQPGEDGISLPNQFEDWRAANPATLAPVVMIDQTPSPTNTFLLPTMRTLLDANKGKIYPEINRLSGLSPEDWQLCTLSIDKIPIYPKLLAHTYMHLALCVEDTSALSELKGCLEAWMSWNNPDITFLINHKLIRSSLVGFLQKSWSGEHMCPRGLQLSDDGKLPDTDIISIGAHVAMILAEETKVRELLSLKDEDAQTVLDLLQALLDISGINPDARRQFLHTLIQLSTNSGRFPQCLTLRPNELEYDHRDYIGQGGFGYVCEGLLLNHKVAVKVLQVKRGGMDQLLKTCSREAAVWCHLDHPNVLPFYGIYHSAEEDFSACLVSPFMERGDIRTYLSNNENVDRSSLVLDVAKGLQYLHENKPTIIHGDLKGANILVSASGRACLADFGLSLAKDSQHLQPSTTQSPLGFTLRWTPPEHLDPALANLSQHSAVRGRMSDIYSFACVCYEIYTSKDPFHGVLGQLIPGLVLAGRRPVKPSPEEWDETGLEDAMWDMIVACWDQKPEQRPTTAQVVKFVEFRYPSLSNITTESAWIPSFLADLASTHANHPFSCMVPRVENLTT